MILGETLQWKQSILKLISQHYITHVQMNGLSPKLILNTQNLIKPTLKNIQAVYYQNGWPLYDTLTNDYNRSSHMNALLNHASLAESQYFLNGLRKGLIRGSLSRGHAATVWLFPPAIWVSDKLRESRLGCNKGSYEFSACWLMSRLSKQKSVI